MSIDFFSYQLQTVIFMAIFLTVLFLSIKNKSNNSFLPIDVTNQLKGFSILTIIFAHIGLFIFPETKFLYPLTISSGVGVNIFLLMSGYGLTSSLLKKGQTPLKFYISRLPKLFVPLWLTGAIFLLLDYLFLGRIYPWEYIYHSFLGFFPKADVLDDLNSPLWYFSLIFFYYLTLPLLYLIRPKIIAALLLGLVSYLILDWRLVPVSVDVLKLYKLHYLAFPIGSILAIVTYKYRPNLVLGINWLQKKIIGLRLLRLAFKIVFPVILICIIVYTTIHSGVGESISREQFISLITTLSIVFLFNELTLEFRLLELVGVYSFEIYLIHWPILSRFDIFYKWLSPASATILDLILIITLAVVIKKGLIQLSWFKTVIKNGTHY